MAKRKNILLPSYQEVWPIGIKETEIRLKQNNDKAYCRLQKYSGIRIKR